MRYKKALLIVPPTGLYRREDRCQSRVDTQTARVIFPPMALAHMASSMVNGGVKCLIRDYAAKGAGWSDFTDDLKKTPADLLIISTTGATLESDLKAARLAKKANPGIRVAVIGMAAGLRDSWVLARYPADFIIRESPESTISWLIDAPVGRVPNISYLKDGKLVRARSLKLTGPLDELFPAARHLLDNRLYRDPRTGRMLTMIECERGCPNSCIFCTAPMTHGKIPRYRRHEHVIYEISQSLKLGIGSFIMNGDTFTHNPGWVMGLCRKIAPLGIEWACNSRVDALNLRMLRAMKDSGCYLIGFGIESGNQQILRKIRKGTTVNAIRRAIALCRQAGIRVHTFSVIGFPWDTEKTIYDTYRLIRQADPDYFDINLATPLPGSEYYAIACREGLVKKLTYDYARASVSTFSLSAPRLERLRARILMRLYARPGYVIRTLLRARSAAELKRLFWSGARRIEHLLSGSLFLLCAQVTL
ncbi:MAG: radical SAM protein [archaeon]